MNIVFFGPARRDKGPFVLLQALQHLSQEHRGRVKLIFAGKAGGVHDSFMAAADSCRKACPALKIELLDRHLSYGEAASLAQQGDLFVLPYLRTDRSSGVLGIAARFGKPVLASESGLLGELVKTHRLGTTVPAGDPARLAAGLAAFLEAGRCAEFDPAQAKRYADTHSPAVFSQTILRAIAHHSHPPPKTEDPKE